MLNEEQLLTKYKEMAPVYDRLGANLCAAIQTFLDEKRIPFLDISSRVKSFESAWEKVSRKHYSSPFEQIEDWCGVRVICYYPSDVQGIGDVLREEFDVEAEEDTAHRLKAQEFGYRSTHFVLKVKDSWLKAPQYRGLASIKAEVQVRTILMHAWAEIEHKLAYKSAEQVPDMFRRRLYRLSAKFEEADEQFEDLRRDLAEYRDAVRENAKDDLESFRDKDVDLDTFQVLLDTAFPERDRSPEQTATLLGEVQELSLSMGDLVDAIKTLRPFINEIESFDAHGDAHGEHECHWVQVGAMRTALDVSNDKYYQGRKKALRKYSRWSKTVTFGRELVGRKNVA